MTDSFHGLVINALNIKSKKTFGLICLLSCAIVMYFLMFTKSSFQWNEVRMDLEYHNFINQSDTRTASIQFDTNLQDQPEEVRDRDKTTVLRYTNSVNEARTSKVSSKFDKKLEVELKEALNRAQNKEFTILVWAAIFGVEYHFQIDPVNCGRCVVTHNKSKESDPDTKAVVFYFTDLDLKAMPLNRRPDQLYAWWTLEAAPALYTLRSIKLDNLDGIFNITMTYRNHSDVYYPFFFTAKDVLESIQKSGSSDPQKDIDELVSKKTGFAFWVVSNCASTWAVRKRMRYARKLIKAGLALDTFGSCFSKHLNRTDIAKNYKFYFTFDNGYHCNDHISEKFHNALKSDAVPVIFGAKKIDYENFGPPNSYIHTDDFETPAKLVEYLNYLDKNVTAYKEYFKWRTMSPEDMPQSHRAWGFCHLCRILHGINVDNIYNPLFKELYSDIPLFGYPQKPRTVASLPKFFYDTEDRECLPDYFSEIGF